MPGFDASPFTIPESLDQVGSHDQTGNAYQQAHMMAVLIREGIDAQGTTRPTNVASGEEAAFDSAKTALLNALDDVVSNARTITDQLPTS